MAETKVEVLRGILVSDQYAFQRRLTELTIGQVYLIKRHWLKYVGKVGNKCKFESLNYVKGGKSGKDGSVLSKMPRHKEGV